MSEYSKQVGVAVTIALVGAFSLAILANYSFPTQPGTVSTDITEELDLSSPLAILRADLNLAIAERVDRLYYVTTTTVTTLQGLPQPRMGQCLADSQQWSQLYPSSLCRVQFSSVQGYGTRT